MVSKTEKIMSIAQNRGFFYPSGEIYSVKAGFWTYGHLGTLLKQKWERLWRKTFLGLNSNYYEIDDVNILTKEVFESSGHLKNFNDPLVECTKCKFRFRADQYVEDETGKETEGLTTTQLDELIEKSKLKCPECGSQLGKTKLFNMMFELKVGATGKDIMYLRPETAQSPYLSFKRQFMSLREKLPMGLAVIGKAFRNEISPRQGFFRLREFTQAELQIFFDPDKIDECENWNKIKDYKLRTFLVADRKSKKINERTPAQLNKRKVPKFYLYHLVQVQKFYLDILKIPKNNFRFRELSEKERAFYNKIHFDVELNLETLGGFKEVAGVHFRGNHDLGGHQAGSKTKLEVVVDGKRFVPHVLELSFGVDRNIWALLDLFFKEEKERNLFTFPHSLSPIDVAIFPLLKKDNLPKIAKEIFDGLKKDFKCSYDETGSIGKMYRRMDEVGCSIMITVDHESLKNKTVTIRDRDSMKQTRIKIKDLKEKISDLFEGKIKFNKTGKSVK
ncbi:glycine--tRNA ligase [Candidatus Woesearchaeota archaeon]|nr:glycine--tRNA ligase [Candidatus Woesearchaeota archaeon]